MTRLNCTTVRCASPDISVSYFQNILYFIQVYTLWGKKWIKLRGLSNIKILQNLRSMSSRTLSLFFGIFAVHLFAYKEGIPSLSNIDEKQIIK
jgi:hypothetical protein